MKKLVLILFVSLSYVYGQNPDFSWVTTVAGNNNFQYSRGNCVDAEANIITVGLFSGSADFDPGTGVYSLSSNGDYDVFVQKLDSSGNFLWAVSYGGNLMDGANSVVCDEQGNIYITGYFQESVDFNPGLSTYTMISTGGKDAYAQKLNADGEFQWARLFGGSNDDEGKSVGVDQFGNTYLTGNFQGTADFDPTGGVMNLISNGVEDVFTVKVDDAGYMIWAKGTGGGFTDWAYSISVDELGCAYVIGMFYGTVDFNPGNADSLIVSNGLRDGFVQKLDSAGNFVWAHGYGGASYDDCYSSAIDNENLIVIGGFQGTVDFDASEGVMLLNSNGSYDLSILKIGLEGTFKWAKSVGGSGSDIGKHVEIDEYGDCYITGSYSSTVDFDPGVDSFILTSTAGADIFLQKVNSLGEFVWAVSMGGANTEIGYAVHVDNARNLYLTGTYNVGFDIDPGIDTVTIEANNSSAFFVLKLNQNIFSHTDEVVYKNGITLYPNPVNKSTPLNLVNSSKVSLEIYVINSIGKIVETSTIKGNSRINLSTFNLKSGLYVAVAYSSEGGAQFTQKFIVAQ